MIVVKDPSDVRSFTLPWAVELNGETIATSEWSGLTVDSSSIGTSSTTVTVSGGSVGKYEMTNKITTSSGETLEKTLEVIVREL